jgi:hypothetical protein
MIAHNAISDVIATFLPDCKNAEELDLRGRLFIARDVATANMAVLDGQALHLNRMIVEAAGAYLYAPVPIDRLNLAVRHCRNLIRCAAGAELLGCA